MSSVFGYHCLFILGILVLLATPMAVSQNTYYVDFEGGSDIFTGTSPDIPSPPSNEGPWKHAPGDPNATGNPESVALQPGDKVLFKGTVIYRGTFEMTTASGAPGAPITYKGDGWPGQEGIRATIDGSELLTGPWVRCESQEACAGNPNWQSIYYTYAPPESIALSSNLYQDEDALTLSQHPNPLDPFTIDVNTTYLSIPPSTVTRTSIVDSRLEDMGGGKLVGSYAFVWVQPDVVVSKKITAYISGENKIIFEDLGLDPYTMNYTLYSIVNSSTSGVLDSPGEYSLDETPEPDGRHKIYLWPLYGGNPNESEISISVRRGIYNREHHIVIEGFIMRRFTGAILGTSDSPQQGLVIRNCEATECRPAGKGNAFYIVDVEDFIFENNYLHHLARLRGIYFDGKDDLLRNNKFENIGGTVIFTGGGENISIIDNEIYDCIGSHSNGISTYSHTPYSSILVARNKVINTLSPYTFSGTFESLVLYNNVFSTDGTGAAISCWGSGPASSDNILIANNIILGSPSDNAIYGGWPNFVIRNNIVDGGGNFTSNRSHNIYTGLSSGQKVSTGWSPGEGEIVDTVEGGEYVAVDMGTIFVNVPSYELPITAIMDGNTIYVEGNQAPRYFEKIQPGDLIEYNSDGIGRTITSLELVEDPSIGKPYPLTKITFTPSATMKEDGVVSIWRAGTSTFIQDLRLKPDSIAIDSGADIGAYLPVDLFPNFNFFTDIDGNPRSQGAGWDIGAYEYPSGAPAEPTNTPLASPTPTPTTPVSPTQTPAVEPTATPTAHGLDLNAGLVGYWKFDVDMNDYSGNGNHGSPVSSPVSVPGRIGDGLQFDGLDDCVEIQHDATLAMTEAVSLSAWVKTAPGSSWDVFVSKGAWNDDYSYYVDNSSQIVFYIAGNGRPTGVNVPSDVWTHVVLTYDMSHARIYMDGTEVYSVSETDAIVPTSNPLYIGRQGDSAGDFFMGSVDEVRIYSRALSPSEVQALFNEPTAPATPTPTPVAMPTNTPTSAPTATPTPTPVPAGILADVDQDGVVTGSDVQLLFEHTLGLEELTAQQLAVADANEDSFVDANDIQCTFLLSIGLPCEGGAAKTSRKKIFSVARTKSIAPSDVTIPPGQTGFIDVMVFGESDIDAYTVDVIIDSSKLEFVSVSNVGTESQNFTLFAGNLVSEDRGRVTGAALFSSPIQVDSSQYSTLFRVELRAKDGAEGSATVGIENPRGDLREVTAGAGTIYITKPSRPWGVKDPRLPSVYRSAALEQQVKSPNWRFWTAEDGLESSFVQELCRSRAGTVLCRHGSGDYVSLLDGYKVSKIPIEALGSTQALGARASPFLKFILSPSDRIWGASGEYKFGAAPKAILRPRDSFRGLFEWTGDEWAKHDIDVAPTDSFFVDLLPMDDERVLLLFRDRIVEWRRSTQRIRVVHEAKEPLGRFMGISRAKDGGIWLFGSGALAKLRSNPLELEAHAYPEDQSFAFLLEESIDPVVREMKGIFAAMESDEGELFIGTPWIEVEKLIRALRFDGEAFHRVGSEEESVKMAWRGEDQSTWLFYGDSVEGEQQSLVRRFPDGQEEAIERKGTLASRVNDLVSDLGHAYWIGTDNGLARHAPAAWRTPYEIREIDRRVHSIHQDSSGRIWFVCQVSILCLDGEQWRIYELPAGIAADGVLTSCFGFLADGRVAILSSGDQLLSFDPRQESLEEIKHPEGKQISFFLGKRDFQEILIHVSSEEGRFLERFDGKTFQPLLQLDPNKTQVADIRDSYEGEDGDLWLAHGDGITRYRDGEFQDYGSEDGFAEKMAFSILGLGDGRIWVGGQDTIHEFNATRWTQVRKGLDTVYSMIKTRDGSIWVASRSGLHRYSVNSWVTVTEDDGLPNSSVIEVFEDRQGRIWAGTISGLSLYHPDADRDPPETFVESEDDLTDIKPGAEVRFVFSGIDKWKQTEADRLLYSYRIDNGGWSPFTSDTVASIAGLSPGPHRFEVRAMDHNWNVDPTPAEIEFILSSAGE